MKTEEDEAFDDLAKRQGSWGGGYQAKRKMAADKLQEPPSEWEGIKAILDEYGLQAIDFVADFKAALAQPPLPVQREWVGLTDAEVRTTIDSIGQYVGCYEEIVARKIEAKLKDKNHG